MLVLPLLLATAQALDPGGAQHAAGADALFWFLQISDTHVGEDLGYGAQDTEHLAWVLDEAVPLVQPAFVVLSGDIVDATNGYLVPTGQYQAEWDEYGDSLAPSGADAAFLHDLCGNHDTYVDEGATYYLANSLTGQATGTWHDAWTVEREFGQYLFVGLNSADTSGAWPGFDSPSLPEDELGFLEEALAEHPEARLGFAFTHHPWGDLEAGGDDLRAILAGAGVSAWSAGHVHSHGLAFGDGVLEATLDSLGKTDHENVGLWAVDHDGLAFRALDAHAWPIVLGTAPLDAGLAGGNPWAYRISVRQVANPIRALAFAPSPLTVTASVDGGPAFALEALAPGVWEGSLDATALAEGLHGLELRALSAEGEDVHALSFEVATTACDNGLDDDANGATDWPADQGCWGPGDDSEAGWEPPPEDSGDSAPPPDSAPPDSALPPDSPPDSAPPGDSAPAHDARDPDRGCACTAQPRPAPGPGLLLVLAAVLGPARRSGTRVHRSAHGSRPARGPRDAFFAPDESGTFLEGQPGIPHGGRP